MKSTHVAECPDLGPTCASTNPPKPYQHDLTNWSYGATLDAALGVTSWLSFAAQLPLRALTTRVKYTDLNGEPYVPDPPDTHHRDRTLVGLGDPAVLAVFGRAFEHVGFSVRAGALLPFGDTLDTDPFEAGREGVVHEHAQFGSGTVRPTLGSALGLELGAIGLDAWTAGVLSLTANSIGYKPGQRFVAGGRVSTTFHTRALFGLGAEVSHESTETWQGEQQEEGNLGRTDVVALVTARAPLTQSIGAYAVARIPLYVHAVGAQLSYPVLLQVGVATSFRAW